jgi:hypothetical protein
MTKLEKRKRIYQAIHKAVTKGNRGCLTGQGIGKLASQASVLSRISLKTIKQLELIAKSS